MRYFLSPQLAPARRIFFSTARALGVALVVIACFGTMPAQAAEIRIVDTAGLVRVVGIIHGDSGAVVVTLHRKEGSIACIATNVDGMAAPRRVTPDKGVCTFKGVTSGTWQVTTEPVERWTARIND